MAHIERVVLVTTGEPNEGMDRAEQAFGWAFQGIAELSRLDLGTVTSLYAAYRNVPRLIGEPNVLFIFIHHDAMPLILPDEKLEMPLVDQPLPPAMLTALADPKLWVQILLELAMREDTGFMGVAGSRSLAAGFAWWNMPDLSGLMVHRDGSGARKLNLYGDWGRVAVLDGVLMMATGAAMAKLPEARPSPDRFHFYDYELSLEAHQAGLKNWTLPLLMTHASGGASVNDPKWQEDMAAFIRRHTISLPYSVPAEPLPGGE